MKKIFILSLALILGIISCENSEKENQLLQKELELLKKEKTLVIENKKLEEKEKIIELNFDVQMNLVHCENKKFTIKIDRLKNNDVRYISWNKPKSISEKPDLIIYKGIIERQGTAGGYHFLFENGEWKYIIENNLMGETMKSIGIFLKVMKSNEEKLYTEMIDLKK